MRTNIDHLPSADRRQLQSLIPVIIKAVRPEKIILYGIYGPGRHDGASADNSGDNSGNSNVPVLPGGYDLLVITRRGDRRYDHEIQDLIENRCRVHSTVTVLVHDIDHVNQRLSEGQYFFSLM